ncbi:MAG: hypothetical protein RI101_00590 [Nitrospira sp.]|jgi:hypothetical protein|nr:hypothetical protein [Nitrospira sp.]
MKLETAKAGLLICLAMLLAACSGGGDSSVSGTSPGVTPVAATKTITGTVAGGAPLVGTVTVKDSSLPPVERAVAVDLAATGKYSMDVTGLTPPFMLRAEGMVGGASVTYFSGIDNVGAAGTVNVNITPFTNLIIGNIAGTIAANYYSSGNFSSLTPQALTSAQQQLRNRLLPLLQGVGLDGTVDLLRASFEANGTGIDEALDIVRMAPDPNDPTLSVIITNLINNQEIIDNLASIADITVIDAAGVSDYDQIAQGFRTLEGLFATRVPASDDAQLLALFDAQGFRFSGATYSEFAAEFLDAQNIGVTFALTPLSFTPSNAPTNARVKLTVKQKNRIPSTVAEWQLNKVTVNNVSTWKSIGNQWIADAGVQAQASNAGGGTTSGLWFIDTFMPAGSGIGYAVVTGRGLGNKGGADGVSPGLLLVNYQNGASPGVAAPPYQGVTTPLRRNDRYNILPLTDQEIQNANFGDNEVYTFVFYDDNGTPSDLSDDVPLNGTGYQVTLPKRPYLSTEFPSVFPVFTSPTAGQVTVAGLSGGNVLAAWTLPAGQLAESIEFVRGTIPNGGGSVTFDYVDIDLVTSAVSTFFTVAPPGAGRTVTSSGLGLTTQDLSGRAFQVWVIP